MAETTGGRVAEWLLEGDPAARWQTLRDLVGAPADVVQAEQRRVAHEGWGAQILARQAPDGAWPSAERHFLYKPYHTSTFFTLVLLRQLGLPGDNPAAHRACDKLLDITLAHTGIAICPPDSETCQTGTGLAVLAHFQHDGPILDALAEHLIDQQLPDGGWNCDLSQVGQYRERVRAKRPTHASVITTIAVLEGLLAYEHATGHDTAAVQARGREFLLAHRLFRSHRTGAVIDPNFMRLTFPPWGYDVLRVLDYFQAAHAAPDSRLTEATDLLRAARQPDGRWLLESRWDGDMHFELERLHEPSRWITLRASRVLNWWERSS